MSPALRFVMVSLVIVNLAFVSVTEAASWSWMGPMLVLTLASPALVRLARYLMVRAIWNVSLLGVFSMLVHHAMNAGAEHLLEDGLMLAALCQVHLLNNIRAGQKPDLLFFNSFLIAVVTSFLSIDVEYMVLFLIYAPLFVIGLHLLAMTKMGVSAGRGLLPRVVLGGVVRSAFVVAVTMAVFALWPRDFQRRGLLGERLRMRAQDGAGGEVDFAERVNLDRSGRVTMSERVVLRVRGPREHMPEHWRGATLDRFDGQEWEPSRGYWYPGLSVWQKVSDGWWVRGGRAVADELEVTLLRGFVHRFFLPLNAHELRVQPPAQFLPIHAMPDLTFWYPRYGQSVSYSVRLGARRQELRGKIPTSLPGRLLPYAVVRQSAMPRQALELAAKLRAELPEDVEQHVYVEAVRQYLSRRFYYLPPGDEGGARSLTQFLSGQAGGHCEYFATALVVMLRSQGIPCRLVTGYRSEEYNELTQTLTVRALHAHAWAEVLDPSGRWYTVDASPAVDTSAEAASSGVFTRIKLFFEMFWSRVTSFDEESREAVIVWLSTLPRRVLVPSLALLAVAALVILARRRRGPPAVRAYRRALKRQGLALNPGETPRQLLDRAGGGEELELATKAHERARYASSA